jgi:dTDP-4-amino-4,6-dideoxygalactose transaminase
MRELVNKALDDNRLSYGPLCRQFEREFAALHGCQYGVTSSSGTASLRVALQALKELHGWHDGDEVIVPAVTFVATVNVVLQCGMKPVLVDVERDYYGMDYRLIDDACAYHTRAIVPVHLFGMPCEMRDIRTVYGPGHLMIIEDSCESMFSHFHDAPVGSWGDIAAFSTYVAHLISTGVGGISTTDNPDYAAKMRSLVNHGRDGIYVAMDDDKGLGAGALQEVVSRRFRFESVGWSARMTELQAALGLAQLETWQEMISKRQSNAAWLTGHLKPYEDRLQLPAVRPGVEHSWMMYPLVLRDEPKWDLVNFLERRGIETREMLPLTNQPVYKGMWNEDDYPVAKWINESGFYLGCHQDLTQADLDWMIESVGEYFGQ